MLQKKDAAGKSVWGLYKLARAGADEINRRLVAAFQYDDYAWQKEKGIRVTYAGRAEGLHKVLYRCPACLTEFRMTSSGATLSCSACGKSWTLSELKYEA